MADRKIDIIIEAKNDASKTLKKMQKELKWVAKETKTLGKNLWNTFKKHSQTIKNFGIATAWAVTAIWFMGKQFLDLWTDIEQTMNKANVVFGDYIDDVKAVAKETASSMWLSQTEYLKAAAWLQDLLIPMGFAREEATKMTTDVIGLSGALAEWSAWQYDAAQVSEILAKAMLGEREQLKSLGISITEADVKQRLLKMGMEDLTGVQLQQAKATATQQLIFEKSTDAQAAFEKWGQSLARQQAEMSAAIKDAKDSIAHALIPAFTEFLKVMQPVIEDVSESIKLWAENEENVKSLWESMKNLIKVMQWVWTVFKWVGKVVWLFWDFLGFLAFDLIQKYKAMHSAAWEFWATMHQVFETMWNFISETIGASVQFVKDAIQDLIDFALAAVNKVKAAFAKVVEVKNKIAGAVSSAASSVKETITWSRAEWWPVQAWRSFIVWERWPELFTPWVSWTITPSWGYSQAPSVNINFWGVTVTKEADENRIAEKVKAALVNEARLFNIWIT